MIGVVVDKKNFHTRFKHINEVEGAILDRFHQVNTLIGKWTYDVRLDVEMTRRRSYQDLQGHNAWVDLKRKRIDALLINDLAIHIFEVKKKLNFSQIGQLLVYRTLYKRQFNPYKPIFLNALSERLDPEIADTMKDLKIKVFII